MPRCIIARDRGRSCHNRHFNPVLLPHSKQSCSPFPCRLYQSHAERLRARRDARHTEEQEQQAIYAEALQQSMASASALWKPHPYPLLQPNGANPPTGFTTGAALPGMVSSGPPGGEIMQQGAGQSMDNMQQQHQQQLLTRQQMLGAPGQFNGMWQQQGFNPAGHNMMGAAVASESSSSSDSDDSSSSSDSDGQAGTGAKAWTAAAAAAAGNSGHRQPTMAGAAHVARRDTDQSCNTHIQVLLRSPDSPALGLGGSAPGLQTGPGYIQQQQWLLNTHGLQGGMVQSTPASASGMQHPTGLAHPLQQQQPSGGGLVRQGSLAADRPRRIIKMTAAAAAAVAAAAASESDSEGSAGRSLSAAGRKKGAGAPAAVVSAALRGKKRGRAASAAAARSSSESAPSSQAADAADSSEFSESEVSRRRGRRSNPAARTCSGGAGAGAGASGSPGGTSSSTRAKRKAGSATAVKIGRATKGSPRTLGAGGGDASRPVFEDTRSQFRGVTRHRRSGRWEAHIWIKEMGR